MAQVRQFPFVRHVRADQTAHMLHFRGEQLIANGRGLSIWVWPLSDSVSEVPIDDRDFVVAVHGRTSDYRDVAVQGAQEKVLRYLARTPIHDVLTDGVAPLREAIDAALVGAPQLPEFGLTVTAVRITAIRPNPELEKAIEAPMRRCASSKNLMRRRSDVAHLPSRKNARSPKTRCRTVSR